MTWKKAGSSSGTRTSVRAPAARRVVHRRVASSAAGKRCSPGPDWIRTRAHPPRYPACGAPWLENATQDRAWQNRVHAWAIASRLQIRREQKIVHVRIVSEAILE